MHQNDKSGVGDCMMATVLRCWWQNPCDGDVVNYVTKAFFHQQDLSPT